MRILLDYRPALRQRTGVGEYVHELARALVATRPARRVADALFVVLEGPAGPRRDARARRQSIARIPVRAAQLRLAPARLAAGRTARRPAVRRRAVGASAADSRDARGAGRHDLRSRLSRSPRADARGDPARLSRARRARTRARADQVVVDLAAHRRRGRATARRAARAHHDRVPPGAPDWPPRASRSRASGCILFLGTLEPRKNLGVLLDAYERLVERRCPTRRRAGARRPSRRPTRPTLVARARRAAARRPRRLSSATSTTASRLDLYRARARCFVLPSHTEGFGMPVARSHDGRRAGRSSPNRGALPEVGRRRRPAVRAGRRRRRWPQALGDVLDDAGAAAADARRGLARSAAVHVGATPPRDVREAWALAVDASERAVAERARCTSASTAASWSADPPASAAICASCSGAGSQRSAVHASRDGASCRADPPDALRALGPARRLARRAAPRVPGTWWEQTRAAAGRARAAGVDVLFAPATRRRFGSRARSCWPSTTSRSSRIRSGSGWREGLRRRWLTRAAARRARRVVTISEFSAGEIVALARRAARPHRASRRRARRAGAARRPADAARRSCCSSDRCFNRRRLPELIRGVRARRGARAGRAARARRRQPHAPADRSARARGESRASRDRVDWRAYVTDAELDALYRSARVFAFLSDYEGFAMTPLEALAHGVPAGAARHAGRARGLRRRRAAACRRDPAAHRATRSRRCSTDDRRARARSWRPAARVLARYSWDAIGARSCCARARTGGRADDARARRHHRQLQHARRISLACLASLHAAPAARASARVVVVDNASTDGSVGGRRARAGRRCTVIALDRECRVRARRTTSAFARRPRR